MGFLNPVSSTPSPHFALTRIIHRRDAEIAEKIRMRMELHVIMRERSAAHVAHITLHFELFSLRPLRLCGGY
jgi:hypothetical protein